jgi:hypothetical protein
LSGNGDSLQFAREIEGILARAGWTSSGLEYSVFDPPVIGLLVQTPNQNPQVEQPGLTALILWLHQVGFMPKSAINSGIRETQIIIGPAA